MVDSPPNLPRDDAIERCSTPTATTTTTTTISPSSSDAVSESTSEPVTPNKRPATPISPSPITVSKESLNTDDDMVPTSSPISQSRYSLSSYFWTSVLP